MKARLYIALLSCIIAISSCKEDEYVYPSVFTEFVDIKTDASGKLAYINIDDGSTFQIKDRSGIEGFTPDSTYRSLSIYEILDESNGANLVRLYSCQFVISVVPTTEDKFTKGIKTDPLDIQSVWKSGNYINLILLPMAKEKSHIFHFIDEGISNNGDGSRTLHLTLYHNQNGDYEAFTRKSYLSIPLWAYEGQLTQGDKVMLRINTYEKGFVSYEFTY